MKYQKKLSDFILLLLSFFGDCLECPQGLYGRNCSNKCSEKCFIYKDCNIKTGVCFGGCAVGWKPPLCNEAITVVIVIKDSHVTWRRGRAQMDVTQDTKGSTATSYMYVSIHFMDQIADWGAATPASTGHVMLWKAAVIWFKTKLATKIARHLLLLVNPGKSCLQF